MLTLKIQDILNKIAEEYISLLIPMPQTSALVIKNERKFDRIDTKLIKEAEKINSKQFGGDVKLQNKREKRRLGSITYRSYTIQFKKQLITSIRQQLLKQGSNLSRIIRNKAQQTGIHPKNITRWYHAKQIKKKQGGRRARYPQMEIRLANFILNNPKMKRQHILRQAKQIMEDLNIPGRNQFNFSKGWYQRFKQRLHKKKVTKGLTSEELVKIEAKQEYDQLKKQQQQWFEMQDEQSYDDDTLDDEEIIKFQQELSDEQQQDRGQEQPLDQELKYSVKLRSHSSKNQLNFTKSIRQSLYFDSESQQDNKETEENSIDKIIESNQNKI